MGSVGSYSVLDDGQHRATQRLRATDGEVAFSKGVYVVSSTAASESMAQCETSGARAGIVETKPESASPPAASPAPAVLQAERTTQSALSFN